MEPMNTDEPKDGFLKKVKALAHKYGALLVFDEMITGFRFSLGGAQKLFGVVPDMATFGKSIANGMPISVLAGRRKYMQRVKDIFFSGTFGGEALSIAAAIATIKEMERKNVIAALWKKGKYLQDATRKLLREAGLESAIRLVGMPCWQLFLFEDAYGYKALEIKSYLQQEMLQAGFLWSGSHNMSFSPSQQDLDRALAAYGKIFPRLKQILLVRHLHRSTKGTPISNIFKVR